MTDPTNALTSFQEHLDGLELQQCELDSNLYLHVDNPSGPNSLRFTYVRIEAGVVTALAMLALGEPMEDGPCFELGYAVPEHLRGQGRAQSAVRSALAEIKHGFGRSGARPFYVHAVVARDNAASKRVAEATLAAKAEEITDAFSGTPAVRYLHKVVYP
ncbi:MAG: GNAT family N-acetyltransferase [Cupriavidus sp.]|nr:GNAT family N-acetyltransferase [Cupriavidus sp.]